MHMHTDRKNMLSKHTRTLTLTHTTHTHTHTRHTHAHTGRLSHQCKVKCDSRQMKSHLGGLISCLYPGGSLVRGGRLQTPYY